MITDENIGNIEFTKIESKAIETYLSEIYSKKVPEPIAPTKADLSFWRIAGVEATLFTIAGLGIAVYSAIRTGGLFFIMETLLLREFNLPQAFSNVVSLSAMVTSLIAFELYVLADGFSKGRANTTMKRSNVGLYSSLGVIVLAGIFTGLGLIENLSETFKVVFYSTIAITTAVAGGLVALFAGENIGFTLSRVEKIKSTLKTTHQASYQQWRDAGVKAYYSSHYAIGSKKSAEFVQNLKTKERQDKVDDFQTFEKEYTDLLYSAIQNFVRKNGRVPDKDELVKLGISEKYAVFALDKYSKEKK